jgi:hypothetical protein
MARAALAVALALAAAATYGGPAGVTLLAPWIGVFPYDFGTNPPRRPQALHPPLESARIVRWSIRPTAISMVQHWSSQLSCFGLLALVALAQPLYPQRVRADGQDSNGAAHCGQSFTGERVSRSELFLGLSKPDGSAVSDAEFLRFIDTEAAPRLPGGFTVVAGQGQFKDPRDGAIVRERARVLVALYPLQDVAASEGIEEIRAAYKAAFRQQSVLRVDGQSCASF